MAFDEGLAQRVRDAAPVELDERRMFSGLCFLRGGHMVCGIVGEELMLRMGEQADAALEQPHTRPMDFTGRPMRGMLFVEPEGIAEEPVLQAWVERALEFNQTLEPK